MHSGFAAPFRFARLAAMAGVFALCSARVSAGEVLIDFGRADRQTKVDEEGRQWNNVTEKMPAGTVIRLVDAGNRASGISLTLTQPFNLGDYNLDGIAALNSAYPATATSDSLFGNVGNFGEESGVVPVLTLGGLDPRRSYDLSFFASRGLTKDNRIVRYEIVGALTSNLFLEANGTTGAHLVSATALRPAADGTFTISVNHSTVNESGFPLIGSGDNETGFAYLGVLHIKYAAGR